MLRSYADGALFGEQVGEGRPRLLALHGWGRNRSDLLPVVEGWPSIAIDLPGFGASPPPPEAMGSDGYSRLVLPVLDQFPERVVVVGHSFGGRVAVHLAASHPELVAGLVLTGTPLLHAASRGGSPAPAYRIIRRLAALGLIGEERLERARRRYGSADYAAASGVMRQVLVRTVAESYEEQLAAITCPVEMVWGAEDTAAPVEAARRAAAILPSANLVVMDGADHFGPLRDPSTIRESLARLLG